jgi:lipopolysaccharide transport system permease protein
MFYGGAIALLLSSLGVYARDISQIVPAFTSLLMFLTPIFYPLAAVPEGLRSYFALNPVAWAAESLRSLLLHQQHLDLSIWSMHIGLSLALFAAGYFCFARLRKGFADVL